MLAGLALLYRIGLQHETLLDEIGQVSRHAGPITRTIAVLIVVFLLAGSLLRKRAIASNAFAMFRIMLSFLIMLVSFEAVIHYVEDSGLPLYDTALQSWDRLLFAGKQPAEWLERVNNEPLTLLLSGAYLSWFALTYGTIFLMMLKGKQAVLEYANAVLLTFYIGYAIYILVPAYGPVFTYTFATKMGGLTGMMADRAMFQPAADAFPSLHTGIAIVMAAQIKRHMKRLYGLYAAAAFLIILSTVYLRIHYAVDVIAGIVLALTIAKLCPRMMKWWNSLQASDSEEKDTADIQVRHANM
jgi:membrane-associated phospholipid phosphatase